MEVCPEAGVVMQQMADRLSQDGGMALLADYGHSGEKTDTFRVDIIFLYLFFYRIWWVMQEALRSFQA